MRQLATYSRWSSHLLINSINDFISTQTVSSGRRIHYNDARFPPWLTLKASKTRDL
ncbi:hypothetical protein HMPREF3197_03131 [Klebsiella pneumoniae]|nr:hypothetical protein HMPREF9538_03726 [Klebsiella sp. MS 92-3]KXA24807.1 hypothetical protein HMPREF3197_03131 [Klebsiella pneumoniae]